jgi:hypothetical protein
VKVGGVENGDWFKHNVSNVLGNSNRLWCWHDIWIRHVSLKELYPDLFRIMWHPNVVVA